MANTHAFIVDFNYKYWNNRLERLRCTSVNIRTSYPTSCKECNRRKKVSFDKEQKIILSCMLWCFFVSNAFLLLLLIQVQVHVSVRNFSIRIIKTLSIIFSIGRSSFIDKTYSDLRNRWPPYKSSMQLLPCVLLNMMWYTQNKCKTCIQFYFLYEYNTIFNDTQVYNCFIIFYYIFISFCLQCASHDFFC